MTEKLSQERLEYLLAIMEKNSIEYSIDNDSYETRLIPEIQQACEQIKAILQQSRKVCRSEMRGFFSGNFWSELTQKERGELNIQIDNCTQFLRYIGFTVEVDDG